MSVPRRSPRTARFRLHAAPAWFAPASVSVGPEAKTLFARRKEVQALPAIPSGRTDPERWAARYATATGRRRPTRTTLVTRIVFHERERGLVAG